MTPSGPARGGAPPLNAKLGPARGGAPPLNWVVVIIAYHTIITAYGFWLPNDPRGPWSDFVRRWELLRFESATKTDTRRSVARQPHDPAVRAAAKRALRYPPVSFSGRQALAIARGFVRAIDRSDLVLHACSILPEHVHIVIRRHTRLTVEKMAAQLKGEATKHLRADGLHPLATFPGPPSPWARNAWHVYLDSPQRVAAAVAYVLENPVREGKRRQTWPFVTPFTGV